jgi:hypothetical protein
MAHERSPRGSDHRVPARSGRCVRRARAVALGLLVAITTGSGCQSPTHPIQYETDSGKPVTSDGLHRVRNTQVGGAFVKPEADFSAYDKVMFDPVTVAYKEPPRRLSPLDRTRGNRELNDESLQRLEQIYHEYVEHELTKSTTYTIVEGARPGVLRVSSHIINLVVNVAPVVGGERDYVNKAGEITVIIDVRDAQTGEPMTRLVDRRALRPGTAPISGGFESTPVTNWGALRDISSNWGRQLRSWLEELHQITIPPAPVSPAAEAQVGS